MATTSYDLIVIGAGPAGYVGAIRAAQLGKRVAVVDIERGGGTCNNWGCIPTKALLKNAELYHQMAHRAEEFGFKIAGLEYDWTKIIKRSRDVSEKGSAGLDYLFKKNKIDFIRGTARLDKAGEVTVTAADGAETTYATKDILIATGCVTRPLPGLPFNGKTVIGSKEALSLPTQPKSIVIIGAGAIGVEFAYFFNAFGTKVTIVELLPNLLPVEDTDVSVALEKSFVKQGVNLLSLCEAAEGIGLRTLPVRCDLNAIIEEGRYPFLAHWNQNHFVVVYGIADRRVYVSDPAAPGLIDYSIGEFQRSYTDRNCVMNSANACTSPSVP